MKRNKSKTIEMSIYSDFDSNEIQSIEDTKYFSWGLVSVSRANEIFFNNGGHNNFGAASHIIVH